MSGKLDVSRINKQSAAADRAMPDKTITVSQRHTTHETTYSSTSNPPQPADTALRVTHDL